MENNFPVTKALRAGYKGRLSEAKLSEKVEETEK